MTRKPPNYLTESQRMVVRCLELLGFSRPEIAETFNVSETSVGYAVADPSKVSPSLQDVSNPSGSRTPVGQSLVSDVHLMLNNPPRLRMDFVVREARTLVESWAAIPDEELARQKAQAKKSLTTIVEELQAEVARLTQRVEHLEHPIIGKTPLRPTLVTREDRYATQ